MKFYSVEKLIGRRFNEATNEYEYKVKWSGYKMEDSTWEPLYSLGKVMGLVKQYDRKLKLVERKQQQEIINEKQQLEADDSSSELIQSILNNYLQFVDLIASNKEFKYLQLNQLKQTLLQFQKNVSLDCSRNIRSLNKQLVRMFKCQKLYLQKRNQLKIEKLIFQQSQENVGNYLNIFELSSDVFIGLKQHEKKQVNEKAIRIKKSIRKQSKENNSSSSQTNSTKSEKQDQNSITYQLLL